MQIDKLIQKLSELRLAGFKGQVYLETKDKLAGTVREPVSHLEIKENIYVAEEILILS